MLAQAIVRINLLQQHDSFLVLSFLLGWYSISLTILNECAIFIVVGDFVNCCNFTKIKHNLILFELLFYFVVIRCNLPCSDVFAQMFYRNIFFALENGIHQVILTPQCKADGVSELSCQIHFYSKWTVCKWKEATSAQFFFGN